MTRTEQAEATVSSATVPEFGPNDWFVEEKYQQFLADPASVDPIWREYFADNRRAANATEPAAAKAAADRTSTGLRPTAAMRPSGAAPAATGKAPESAATTASAPAIPATPPPPPPPAPRPRRLTAECRARRRRGHETCEPHAKGPGSAGDHCGEAGPRRRDQRRIGDEADRPPRRPRTTPAAVKQAKQAKVAAGRRAGRNRPDPRRGRGGGPQHDRLAGGADRHVGARGAGQADRRQPDRHQQLPQAQPGRKGLVHPPDRLRDHPGGQRPPGHEPALRRGGRQADDRHPGAHQPRPGHRPARPQRPTGTGGRADPGHREDDVHPVLVGLRGGGAQGSQGRADRRGLRRAPPSR